ncbi:hypothetical protein M9H77_07025 [Catharanthus roseus]|uniref:Uncharacterized protein n=1 Tax=Catharanthus roseus TaxID=4058 RepID=A0ACC0BTS7_CATRO|nr:hypothetical protein M9H77_07025 [Catharanthus roseus]
MAHQTTSIVTKQDSTAVEKHVPPKVTENTLIQTSKANELTFQQWRKSKIHRLGASEPRPPCKSHKFDISLSIDSKIFEVDETVAKQSVTIEYLIEDKLTSTDPFVIPNIFGDILAKIIEYCKRVATQPPSGKNDAELKAFVSELVNDNEQTLFGLLVTADYLAIKGLLSLAYEEFLYLIKCKDPAHIRRLFNITPEFLPEEEERMRSANL